MAVTLNASTTTGLVQSADTSGTVEIQSNGTTRLTVASGGVTTTGNTSIANLTATGTFGGGVITSGTAVASTSGTSIDFTSIPSWVKRITVMLNGVSSNGSSSYQVQLGDSGGIETTGYSSASAFLGSTTGGTNSTTGLLINTSINSSNTFTGAIYISRLNGNIYVATSNLIYDTTSPTSFVILSAGTKTLSDTLDRLRITTVNGTDTFDAGTINILYEG
jgi:hypothetical protein